MSKNAWWIVILFLVIAAWTRPATAQQLPGGKANLATTMKDFHNLNIGQQNEILSAMGLPSIPGGGFSVAKIIAWVVFGSVGFVAFVYGKKQENIMALVIGIALMAYPYFTNNTVALYAVGTGLCLALYYFRG